MPTGVGVFQLPIPIVGGADEPTGLFTIPMVVIEGAGYSLGEPFVIPVPTFTGTGSAPESDVLFHVPIISVTSYGYLEILGTGIFNVPKFSWLGAGGRGGIGSFTLPQFVLGNFIPLHGVGSFVIPIPAYAGFGDLIPVSKIYRGIVMNLSNQAMSTYSGFNFNSLTYFDGAYYGINDQGIFKLGGDRDNLTRRINSKMKLGPMNFGDNNIKHARDLWITFRSDGHLQVTFMVDENEDVTSIGQTEFVADGIREEKIKCGRGLKGRFFTVVIENMSGADFDIEQISLMIDSIRRKLR